MCSSPLRPLQDYGMSAGGGSGHGMFDAARVAALNAEAAYQRTEPLGRTLQPAAVTKSRGAALGPLHIPTGGRRPPGSE